MPRQASRRIAPFTSTTAASPRPQESRNFGAGAPATQGVDMHSEHAKRARRTASLAIPLLLAAFLPSCEDQGPSPSPRQPQEMPLEGGVRFTLREGYPSY